MATNIKKTSFILFILRLLKMSVTIITVTFTAKFFGVSMERDMWVMALTVVSTITMAVWGPLNEIFRTKFVFVKESEGEYVAIEKTASLVGFVFVSTLILSLSILCLSPFLADAMVINGTNEARHIFMLLLVLQIPTLLISELTNIGISILNAYEIYYVPEIVSFVSGCVNLLAIIVFAPVIGIYSLLIATYFGALLLFFLLLHFLRIKRIFIWSRLIRFKWSDAKIFLLFSLPFFFPYFVGQMNGFFEKYLGLV